MNFIDKEYLYQNTNIQKNVLDIDKYINQSTLLYVKPQLGQNYFNILYSNYINNRILQDTLEFQVLEYVKLASAYFSVGLILPNIHFHNTNNGVLMKPGGDNINVESRDLQYLVTQNIQNGQRFLDNALDILKCNKHIFPFFTIRNEDKEVNNNYGGIIFN